MYYKLLLQEKYGQTGTEILLFPTFKHRNLLDEKSTDILKTTFLFPKSYKVQIIYIVCALSLNSYYYFYYNLNAYKSYIKIIHNTTTITLLLNSH